MNKSYPQFNLKTLQLPAPASPLTKAEYKEAYGIDLDDTDVKAFKLVIFGNNKYAIDQIKEVEGGYEIYFNGRILSITDNVQTSEKVYDIANTKPIYCHPISLIANSGPFVDTRMIILLFNNVSEAYTKGNLKVALDSLNGRISINGFAKYSSKYGPTAYYAGGNIVYLDQDAQIATIGLEGFLATATVDLEDLVNKIN